MQAAIFGTLTAIELMVEKEDKVAASVIVENIGIAWCNKIYDSQNVELKNTDNVVNVFRANKTIN